jgi:hypothetical protein
MTIEKKVDIKEFLEVMDEEEKNRFARTSYDEVLGRLRDSLETIDLIVDEHKEKNLINAIGEYQKMKNILERTGLWSSELEMYLNQAKDNRLQNNRLHELVRGLRNKYNLTAK